jgi:hypothetical protein
MLSDRVWRAAAHLLPYEFSNRTKELMQPGEAGWGSGGLRGFSVE